MTTSSSVFICQLRPDFRETECWFLSLSFIDQETLAHTEERDFNAFFWHDFERAMLLKHSTNFSVMQVYLNFFVEVLVPILFVFSKENTFWWWRWEMLLNKEISKKIIFKNSLLKIFIIKSTTKVNDHYDKCDRKKNWWRLKSKKS